MDQTGILQNWTLRLILIQTFHNVINNELTSTAQTRHGINPANRQPNSEVPVSTQADLDRAVDAAQKAFQQWSKVPLEERRAAVIAFGDAVDAHKDDFAKLLTMEQGKPLAQSYHEIGMAVEWLRKIPTLELSEEIAPALYTGNVIIIKPSPYTPYCDLKLGELGTRFFPPGVLQVLSGGDDLGPRMTAHPGIGYVSFTGSSVTGKKVMASCASTLKRVTLELGGNDPAIICEDVDIDAILPKIATLCFYCSSQICMMIKRLYVHEKIYDQFRDAFVKYTQALKSGDGTEPDVFFGPVQNEMQYEKVKDLFTTITTDGLNPALGGKIEPSKGYFITPTIIDNPPEKSRVVTEEPFGPIVPLLKWSDEEDVIARANDSQMGLGSSVWSKDIDRATRMARRLESGSAYCNSQSLWLPKKK
ncbi:hypothetical protein VTN77DRAFT_4771 [Rasamsonia byssochlamydoides]|uniref:uncharacterized protein n=1 Tax=Rasamsonia byssochlamydoides TaxID=89139 RepID=UPI00374495D8